MTTKNYNLRKAVADDHKAIRDLLEECQLPIHDISADDLKHFFIIENKHEIIGTIGLEAFDEYGLLRSLAIKKEHRNKRFGERLVFKLEDYAVQQNIRGLFLLTTTADSYFSKHGYQKAGRDQAPESIQNSKEFSNICPDSAVLMKKNIAK